METATFAGVFGAMIGSFLNVVVYRLPRRESLVRPASHCTACGTAIKPYDNIPVVSWLLLRGRCRNCSAPISKRYPLVEALTALLSAVVAWRFGLGWPALAALVLTWYLVALTFIDVDHQLLPDSLTVPLLWGGLFISLFSAYAGEAAVPVDVRSGVIGAIAGYLSLWSVYHLFRLLTGKEGMGYGDFKLFAALGAWLGWQMLLPVILLAAVSGTVIGLALIGLRRHDRASPLPFGPFLAASGWLVLVYGPPQIARYLGLF